MAYILYGRQSLPISSRFNTSSERKYEERLISETSAMHRHICRNPLPIHKIGILSYRELYGDEGQTAQLVKFLPM
jgi:hypothetical protein